MCKKIATFLLLAAFAVYTLSRVVMVFGFYANQKQIAATLCENKDKPILNCEGKCQLSKQLKLQEKKEQQNPDQRSENKPEDISSRSFYSCLTAGSQANAVHYEKSRNYGKPVHRSFAVFHPPIHTIHLG